MWEQMMDRMAVALAYLRMLVLDQLKQKCFILMLAMLQMTSVQHGQELMRMI